MKKALKLLFIVIFLPSVSHTQTTQERDSLSAVSLDEVVVIGHSPDIIHQTIKKLGNVDEYLSHSSKVNLVKRGAYAWEPMINNMATERTMTTIDGMHIFGACTDKMDPITSYVETTNLSEIQVCSGQEGNASGAVIGGSLNLVRKRTNCGCATPWSTTLYTGYETNGNQRILMGHSGYSSERFYTDVSASFRKADPYKDGKNELLKYSQFQKYNISAIIGKKIGEDGLLEGDLIYDRAIDVGYPALPMDVSLAEAIIGSLSYTLSPENSWFIRWKSKVYYNTITHIMDDTTRPDVVIHMDMPGYSDTFGGFSQLMSQLKNHSLEGQFTFYMNRSTAEMTMYPKDKMEALMFMYTWPQVRTLYSGISLSDKIRLTNSNILTLKTAFGTNYSYVPKSDIYSFPEMEQGRLRFLPSLSLNWKKFLEDFDITLGIGYGQRAPSVSEAYGFFLFNSFDGYDYLGNPKLENEVSYEAKFGISAQASRAKIQWSVNYFHIQNYIIGKIIDGVSVMTYGANGVRQYVGLPYAHILNAEFELMYTLAPDWYWKTNLKYAIGQNDKGNPLPLIQPFTYRNGVYFHKSKWNVELTMEGATQQSNYSKEYGEDLTPAYTIFNTSCGYDWSLGETTATIQLGVENLFNRYYSTYSDWRNIPRKGRNIYIGIQYTF